MDRIGGDIGWRATAALTRYCSAIDQHDSSALRAVFSADAVLVVGPRKAVGSGPEPRRFSGRDSIVEMLSALFATREWARHLVSNVVVAPRADGALDVRSYFQFVQAYPSSTARGIGDYVATMRENDGRLLITHLAVSILDQVTDQRPAQKEAT